MRKSLKRSLGITVKFKHDREDKMVFNFLGYIKVKKLRQLLGLLTLRIRWRRIEFYFKPTSGLDT